MCRLIGAQGVIVSMAMLSVFSVFAQSASSKSAPVSRNPAKISSAVQQDPGEKAFQANCGRCHKPPDQLSPRISGTVVRHMRVRASLSAADERAILRFLAP
jgi:cytochrome c5